MRVLIVGVGTRGDVAPYAGLGVRLRAAGHEVAIAAHEPYARLVTDAGLEFRAIPGDPLAVLAGGVRPAGVRGFVEYGRQVEDGIVAAAEQGADVLLLNVPASAGWHVAEALGIASMGVHLQPVEPTGDFPPVLGPFTRSLGRWGNRVAARTAFVMPSPAHAGSAGRLRARLGLPPMSSREAYRRREAAGWPVFHGFSPLVLPRPGDWRAGLEVTGYWWPEREQGWRPPDGLEDFLEAGPPPVFVGLGSLTGTHGGRVAEPVVRALRQAGLRAVVQIGAADMAAGMAAGMAADAMAGIKAGSGADGVFGLGEVPHDWLFPRVAAVAHHAGAGTTGAGIRAGVPGVGLPVMADQALWASRLAALGVGPAPVPLRRLTAGRLADALRAAVTEPAYRRRARELAAGVAAEDGAGAVVEAVNRLAGG